MTKLQGLYYLNFILAHSGSSYEVNSDLQGQECYSLCDIQPLGSILTTTTSTVVLVYHGENGGHHGIACRTLKPPQGLLGGIGRRVSSFIWGGTPSGTTGSEAVSFSKAFSIGLALLSNDFFKSANVKYETVNRTVTRKPFQI